MTDHVPPCPKVAKGQACAPCEELAAIKQEIATLNAKLTTVYGRINFAHDPLTSKLPAEIVAKIFTNIFPVNVDAAYTFSQSSYPRRNEFFKTPLLLGAVCTAWRAIAWSTPRLWTSISLCINYVNKTRCDIFRNWLGRSGGPPLYINIYQVDYMRDTALFKEIMNLLALHSHKLFYFEFDIDEEYVHYLNSTFAHAHVLNTLKIGICSTLKINLGMTSNLRNLYMDAPYIGQLLDINWQKLTNAEATFPSIDMCFEFFFECIPSQTLHFPH